MEMTNEEICRSYRLAKNKNEQVLRLADLNLCDKKTILDILTEGGEISGIKTSGAVQKKKPVSKFSPEVKQEILRLSEEGVKPKDIAERLGFAPGQIYNQLYYMRNTLRENTPESTESTSKPEQPATNPVNLKDGLRKLRIEDAVIDLSEMFIHLKNLFTMVKEYEILESDVGSVNVDTLAIAGECLCDNYINRLDEIIGQII